MEEVKEIKKVHGKSLEKVKNFLDDIYALTSKNYVNKNCFFVAKNGERVHLTTAHQITNAYNSKFLVENGVLEDNNKKIKWCYETEPTYELVLKLKAIENHKKNHKTKSKEEERAEKIIDDSITLEDVENPVEELSSKLEENSKSSKKSFLDLMYKLDNKVDKLDNKVDKLESNDNVLNSKMILLNEKMDRIISLLEEPIKESSKIVIEGLMTHMNNGN
jgi:hypothetical protein